MEEFSLPFVATKSTKQRTSSRPHVRARAFSSTSNPGYHYDEIRDGSRTSFHPSDPETSSSSYDHVDRVDHNVRKKKKKKFTAEEKRILVEKVVSHYNELFGKKSHHLPLRTKTHIWGKIASTINSLGVEKRSIAELKKKWHDTRRRSKEKISKMKVHQTASGGGPPTGVILDPVDELVISTYDNNNKQQTEEASNPEIMEFNPSGGVADSYKSEESDVDEYLPPPEVERIAMPEPDIEPENIGEDFPFLPSEANFLNQYMDGTFSFFNNLISTNRQICEAILSVQNVIKEGFTAIHSDLSQIKQAILSTKSKAPDGPIRDPATASGPSSFAQISPCAFLVSPNIVGLEKSTASNLVHTTVNDNTQNLSAVITSPPGIPLVSLPIPLQAGSAIIHSDLPSTSAGAANDTANVEVDIKIESPSVSPVSSERKLRRRR